MKEIAEIVRSFEQANSEGRSCALVTLIHVDGSSYRRPGARMLVTEEGRMAGAASGGFLEGGALAKALHAIHRRRSMIVADVLGRKATVVDGCPRLTKRYRSMSSCQVILAIPSDALDHVAVDSQTAVLLMTHSYSYDLAVLRELLIRDCTYIGCLGPRKKLDRMLGELRAGGMTIGDPSLQTIHGPAGLDIGAETPEEIALSILAEIKKVFCNRMRPFLHPQTYPHLE